METFVGDILRITLETDIDLTGLTIGIKFVRPDGSVGYWPATIYPLDLSKMYYDTDTNDLNVPGYWRLQAFTESAGVRSHGKVVELKVFKTLTDREVVTTPVPTTPAP